MRENCSFRLSDGTIILGEENHGLSYRAIVLYVIPHVSAPLFIHNRKKYKYRIFSSLDVGEKSLKGLTTNAFEV